MSVRKTLAFATRILSARIREPKLPWRVNLAVTYSCNARCVMCNVWRVYAEKPKLIHEEMTLEHFDKLFSELGPHLYWLHLTGGEPFLREDLVKLAEVAVNKCKNLYAVEVPTNGLVPKLVETKVEQMLKILRERKVALGIGVSIDGPPEVHNYMRGVEGAWEKAVETLRRLKDLERSYGNLHVVAAYTVTRHNAGRLPELYNRLQKVVKLEPNEILVNVEQRGVLYHNLSEQKEYEVAKGGIAKDILWILERYRRGHFKKPLMQVWSRFRLAFAQLAMQYVNGPMRIVLPCEALRSVVFIDPYGDVYPCIIWNVKLGNVKTSSLKEVLHNDTAAKMKNAVHKGECPHCWTGCEAMPTILVRYWRAGLF